MNWWFYWWMRRFTILKFFKDEALVKKIYLGFLVAGSLRILTFHITWKLSYSPNPFMLFIYRDGQKLTNVLRTSLLISFQWFPPSFSRFVIPSSIKRQVRLWVSFLLFLTKWLSHWEGILGFRVSKPSDGFPNSFLFPKSFAPLHLLRKPLWFPLFGMPKCLREWIICLASFAWEGEYSGSSPEILCLGVVVLMVCSLQEIGGGPWSFSLGLLYRLLPVDSVLKTFMFILACNTGCSSLFEEVLLNPPFCDKWRILFFCHFVDILLGRNSRILKKVERSSEELLEAIWFNSSLWVSAWHHSSRSGFVFVISFGVFFCCCVCFSVCPVYPFVFLHECLISY